MSLNLHCRCLLPGCAEIPVPLIQTPTEVSHHILGTGSPWQNVLRRYLAWVQGQDPEAHKRERRRMGQLWQTTECLGGRMIFEVW